MKRLIFDIFVLGTRIMSPGRKCRSSDRFPELTMCFMSTLFTSTVSFDARRNKRSSLVLALSFTPPAMVTVTTVIEAVTIAGGVNDRARTSELLLFRRASKDTVEVKRVDMKHMVSSGNLSEDLHLRPGDMILVPRTNMSKISRFIPFPSLGMYFNPAVH